MFEILQLVLYLLAIFLVPYWGFSLLMLLFYTLPTEQLLPLAIQNTNFQIQH